MPPILNERFVVCSNDRFMRPDGLFVQDISHARKFVVFETAVKAAKCVIKDRKSDYKIIAIKVLSSK